MVSICQFIAHNLEGAPVPMSSMHERKIARSDDESSQNTTGKVLGVWSKVRVFDRPVAADIRAGSVQAV